MVNPRTKGQGGEREACRWLAEQLQSEPLQRALGQARDGGGDILDIEGLTIEVKRHEILNVNTWWRQVQRAADNNSTVPVLMYRQNRKPWTFCLPASLLVPGLKGRITLGESEMAGWLLAWVS
jgi:hypothetical protein